MFQLLKKDATTRGRMGVLKTAHGGIATPFFMPVGTNATVKCMSAEELLEMGAQIVLSNTYHLYLRPGMDIIGQFGGLHGFMSWEKPILTDSGGYQVFSLSKLRKISDEGVVFQSHLDGSSHFFTPERVMEIEQKLGSDMIMPLDECAPYPCDYEQAEESVARTTLWAERSKERFHLLQKEAGRQILFGIIQGATYEDLRKRSAEEIMKIGFEAYAIGGVSVGEPVKYMFETVDWVEPLLPQDRPRYLMGIGMPDQIVKAVAGGIDMFDTCIPTRYGRNGTAFTSRGKIIVRNGEFARDERPVDDNCPCFVCRKYSRSYIRHLVNNGEILGLRFLSYHNLYFYHQLFKDIRAAIAADKLAEFQKAFLELYGSDLAESVTEGRRDA